MGFTRKRGQMLQFRHVIRLEDECFTYVTGPGSVLMLFSASDEDGGDAIPTHDDGSDDDDDEPDMGEDDDDMEDMEDSLDEDDDEDGELCPLSGGLCCFRRTVVDNIFGLCHKAFSMMSYGRYFIDLSSDVVDVFVSGFDFPAKKFKSSSLSGKRKSEKVSVLWPQSTV